MRFSDLRLNEVFASCPAFLTVPFIYMKISDTSTHNAIILKFNGGGQSSIVSIGLDKDVTPLPSVISISLDGQIEHISLLKKLSIQDTCIKIPELKSGDRFRFPNSSTQYMFLSCHPEYAFICAYNTNNASVHNIAYNQDTIAIVERLCFSEN